MKNKLISISALLGAMGVILGAFGAHGVKPLIEASSYNSYQTAVEYHFYHTFIIFAIAILMEFGRKEKLLYKAAYFFMGGIFLFSGSLYLLSTSSLLGLDAFRKILGPLTPIGGLSFIIGWLLLFWAGMRNNVIKPGDHS